MLNGIIEIDVHGKNVEAAIEEIRKFVSTLEINENNNRLFDKEYL